jgi:hypothetical protein
VIFGPGPVGEEAFTPTILPSVDAGGVISAAFNESSGLAVSFCEAVGETPSESERGFRRFASG